MRKTKNGGTYTTTRHLSAPLRLPGCFMAVRAVDGTYNSLAFARGIFNAGECV